MVNPTVQVPLPPAKAPAAGPIETVKNCAACNKPMKKAKRYYRNGKYYCNKKCAKSAGQETEKLASKETEKPAPKEAQKEKKE